MKSHEQSPIFYVENDEAEAAILLGRAVMEWYKSGDKLPDEMRPGLDQLHARIRDYRLATIDRSMGGDREEVRRHVDYLRRPETIEAFRRYDRDLPPEPPVDIDRPDLAEALVIKGEEARIVLSGLEAFAQKGDKFVKLQVKKFQEDHRLDLPVTAQQTQSTR